MTWRVEYMRYQVPGSYDADTLSEAVGVALGWIEEGWASPSGIYGPSGRCIVDHQALSDAYARDYGRIPTSEIVAKMVANDSAPSVVHE